MYQKTAYNPSFGTFIVSQARGGGCRGLAAAPRSGGGGCGRAAGGGDHRLTGGGGYWVASALEPEIRPFGSGVSVFRSLNILSARLWSHCTATPSFGVW
jgi:hypothetical protein